VFGLEDYVKFEMREQLGRDVIFRGRNKTGRFRVETATNPTNLIALRSATAISGVLSFPTKRPTGLLGHGNFTLLKSKALDVIRRYPAGTFATLSMSASGKNSNVYRRLIDDLCDELGLEYADDQGDLAIAVSRSSQDEAGWDVSIRLTPRPLSTREWRVCNMPGAINATVAHVVAELTNPAPHQRFLNLACGSSTILIERLSISSARSATGVDIDPSALACSVENLTAAGMSDDTKLVEADATNLPFPNSSFHAIAADLPFGMLVAHKGDKDVFHPKLLLEAARVAKSQAIFSFISVSERSIKRAIDSVGQYWRLVETVPFSLSFKRGYINPSIYILQRSDVEMPATGVSAV
jgi:ubiquinone/menaquinone biosynthesis C-methylase UbiE